MAFKCDLLRQGPPWWGTKCGIAREQQTKKRYDPQPQRVRAVVDGSHRHIRVCNPLPKAGKVTKASLKAATMAEAMQCVLDVPRDAAARWRTSRQAESWNRSFRSGSGQLVSALPAQDLYLALVGHRSGRRAELVAMATPEQFRHLVAWLPGGDRTKGPRHSEVLRWLRLAREGDADLDKFRQQLWSLDIELLALVSGASCGCTTDRGGAATTAGSGMAYTRPTAGFLLSSPALAIRSGGS